ncbi:hypothetical protein [Loktanella sp. 3ANDIMAR09]|uniref:hypothetical protein n=1 Tax=Loktanella sp. 3ANDIMAR09 TaxID=1225657 RepID=UPI000A673C15|nr:hypothetical protein [Loktanella sp. 3ANDIMAR09]
MTPLPAPPKAPPTTAERNALIARQAELKLMSTLPTRVRLMSSVSFHALMVTS